MHDVPRTATVVSQEVSELLWVNNKEFKDTGLYDYFMQQHEWRVSVLKRLGVFNSLSESQLDAFARAFRLNRMDQNSVLQAQGARPTHFCVLTKGVCKVREVVDVWFGRAFSPMYDFLLLHRLPCANCLVVV